MRAGAQPKEQSHAGQVTGLTPAQSDEDKGPASLERQAGAGPIPEGEDMDLGAFSVSLTVKDLEASRSFYEKLGFKVFAGDAAQNWLIMKSGDHAIGLFQGMFERNILTFNPGWDANAAESRHVHRCPRTATHSEGARDSVSTPGRRELHGASQLCRRRSGRKPDSVRSTRMSSCARQE